MIITCFYCGTVITRRTVDVARSKTGQFACSKCKGQAKRRHDWKKIQEVYDTGKTIAEIIEVARVSWSTIQKAIKRGEFVTRSLSSANKLALSAGRRNIKVSENHKRKLRELAIARGFGGKRNSHNVVYKGVTLESSYELRFAQLLDNLGVNWVRPSPLCWVDTEGRMRKYFPDFEIVEPLIYVDTKNDYLIKKDRSKLVAVSQQNAVVISLLSNEKLKELESRTDIDLEGIVNYLLANRVKD